MKKICLFFVVFLELLFSQNKLFEETKNIISTLNKSKTTSLIGKYNFSFQNLVDTHLIKEQNFIYSSYIHKSNQTTTIHWRDALNEDKFINNPKNWTIEGGKEAFLCSEALQEEAMNILLTQNFEVLLQKGLDMNNTQSSKALLVASHFGGVESAKMYALENSDLTISKEVKLSSYFKIGAGGETLAKEAQRFLGKRYIWGGVNPNIGADCSGYVQYLYKKVGINLPRTAFQQSKYGQNIPLDSFSKGDLLFFNTDSKRRLPVTHVGIYLDNNRFIHSASSKKGVIVSSFESYKRFFIKAKRLIKTENTIPQSFQTTKTITLNLEIDELLKKIQEPTLFKATMAQSKVELENDPLIIKDGRYIHQSQDTKD